MYCDSALQKAYRQTCCICDKGIYYGNYETVTTKPSRGKAGSHKGKTLYAHTECVNKEYGLKLYVHDPYKRVVRPFRGPVIC